MIPVEVFVWGPLVLNVHLDRKVCSNVYLLQGKVALSMGGGEKYKVRRKNKTHLSQ